MNRRRYSLVTRGLWTDARFLELSRGEPNAQTLWLYLLTGPIQGPIPGLFPAGVGTIADGLGWSYEDARACLEELRAQGMVRVSERPPLLWLPNAARHNPPGSPNVVKSWGAAYRELPETDLRDEAMVGIRSHIEGEAFLRAFDATFPDLRKPSPKASRKASGKGSPKGSPKPFSKAYPEGPSKGKTLDPRVSKSEGPKETLRSRRPAVYPSGKASPKASPNQDHRTKNINKRQKSEEAAARLALLLRESIRSHTPRIAERYDGAGARKLAGWEKDLEKLIRLDGASEGEVAAVISWAHKADPSGFWKPNLLSGGKIRQHFDRLIIQVRQSGATISTGATDPTREWMQHHHRWLLRWRDERVALGQEVTEKGLLGACEGAGVPRPAKPSALLAWLGQRR